jgi:hypothetical protein
MEKNWFFCTAVKKAPDGTIAQLQISSFNDETMRLEVNQVRTRNYIIKAIEEANFPLKTAIKNASYTYGFGPGPQVRVISSGGKKYLRTDANEIAADNLGELPEI